MTQSAIETQTAAPLRQENQRDAKRDADVVRLLSSEEIAAASDFYDAAPCTD
jgi:hypothetical protein